MGSNGFRLRASRQAGAAQLPRRDPTHALLAYRWTIETEIPIMESEKNVHMVVLTLRERQVESDAYIPDSLVRKNVEPVNELVCPLQGWWTSSSFAFALTVLCPGAGPPAIFTWKLQHVPFTSERFLLLISCSTPPPLYWL